MCRLQAWPHVCVRVRVCVLFQVPPAPLPASMWKKSQILLLLSPGGLVLIITVQLLPTPSRLEPLSPWVGKLLAQVGLLTSLHWSKHLLHSFFLPCPSAFSSLVVIYWDFMCNFVFFGFGVCLLRIAKLASGSDWFLWPCVFLHCVFCWLK